MPRLLGIFDAFRSFWMLEDAELAEVTALEAATVSQNGYTLRTVRDLVQRSDIITPLPTTSTTVER